MKTSEVKEIYNKEIVNKYKSDYEYNRWFKNDMLKAGYDMTKASIAKHVINGNDLKFRDCLELGPGAGTWTKLLLEKFHEAHYDLVDISREMLKIAREALCDYDNISYFEIDFLEFDSQKKYDFFFSSRVIEYFPSKEILIKKITDFIGSNGRGFIITKTPKYFINKILRREVRKFHQGQIQPAQLKVLLEKNSCEDIKIYPVTFSFPLLKSARINRILYKIFGDFQINFISKFFSESYCVKFIKR